MKKIITFCFVLSSLTMTGCNYTQQILSDSDSSRPTTTKDTYSEVAAANIKLGIAYLKRSEYEKALKKLQKAQQADPDYPLTYNILGVLHQRIGKNELAEKYYKKSLSLDRSSPETLNNYGQFLCHLGRYDEAEKFFLKAARNPLYTTPEIAFTNAGICKVIEEKLGIAESYFRQALEKEPKIAIALMQMLKISFNTSKYLSARAYLQRYIEVNPHTAESLWFGIRIERKLGDKDALASYKLLLRNKFPDSEEAGLLKDSWRR